MKIMIKGSHVSVTDALKEHARTKLQKLERFFDNIQEISVDLDVKDVSDENQRQIASATVFASGTILRGQEHHQDMYAAIDLLLDKLEKQLKKHKEKLRDRAKREGHKVGGAGAILPPQTDDQSGQDHKPEGKYVRKPMSPEDAVLLLQENHVPFLVFHDMKTQKVSVVYPLGDDEYGLIETA